MPHTRNATPRIGLLSALTLPVLLTALAACDARNVDQVTGDVRDAKTAPTGTALTLEPFKDDVAAQAGTEVRALIRSAEGYRDLFGHAPPTGVDFSRSWVLFYSAGSRPTGGYEASIVSLVRSGQLLAATTQLVSPGPNCAVTEAFTTPYALVKFNMQPGTSIAFFKSDRENDCGGGGGDPCATVKCAAGTHCEAQKVECVTTPCPPVAACVPDAAPTRCGGFAGIACPGAGSCVDDPSDSCDPKAGGADCGGICQCSGAAVLCIAGSYFDSSPAVCACVPKTTCGPVCDIYCEYGNVVDATGCPTCRCNPPPPDAIRCGGIAGIACPGNSRCVDDPTDSCDPNNGGADCGGICRCVQTGACVAGAKFDSSLAVCACVAPPPPAKSCPPEQCTGPMPKSANYVCPDGKTLAGPACVHSADGTTCGWQVLACPAG